MRTLLFALVLVNFAVFAWSRWLSPSSTPVPSTAMAGVPQIQLASEARAEAATVADGEGTGASEGAGSPVESGSSPASGLAPASDPVLGSGPASGDAASTDPGVGLASASAPGGAALAGCLSIGPFESPAEAGRAGGAFEASGYSTRQRVEDARVTEGYWVSLPRQPTVADETRVLARLARASITDARVMADAEGRRISIGLFSERERADRRAAAVQQLGFDADITERVRVGASYWVDLLLKTSAELAEAERFNEEQQGTLTMKPCPAAPAAG